MLSRTLAAAVLIAVGLLANQAWSDSPPKSKESSDEPPPARLPTEAESMRAKLNYAQALLDAITREDFKRIEENATSLVRISEGAEILKAHKSDTYTLQARLFQQTVSTMAARARDKNIEGVLLAYHDMSSSCLKCHQYIRDRKKRD